MNVSEFELLARMEMRQHGLRGWEVAFSEDMPKHGAKFDTLAYCDPSKKQLVFSARCLSCYAVALESIRHELSHSLDWEERKTWFNGRRVEHHRANWRKWCKIVGCPARMVIPA